MLILIKERPWVKLIMVEWKCGKFSQLSASHTLIGERISDEGESVCVCVCVCVCV